MNAPSNSFRLHITYLKDLHSYKSSALRNIHFSNPLVPFAILVNPEKILFCLQKCLISTLLFLNIHNTIIPFYIYPTPPHLFLNDRYFERLETSCFFSRHRSMSCPQSVCSGKEVSWVENFNKGATGSQGLKSKPLGTVFLDWHCCWSHKFKTFGDNVSSRWHRWSNPINPYPLTKSRELFQTPKFTPNPPFYSQKNVSKLFPRLFIPVQPFTTHLFPNAPSSSSMLLICPSPPPPQPFLFLLISFPHLPSTISLPFPPSLLHLKSWPKPLIPTISQDLIGPEPLVLR